MLPIYSPPLPLDSKNNKQNFDWFYDGELNEFLIFGQNRLLPEDTKSMPKKKMTKKQRKMAKRKRKRMELKKPKENKAPPTSPQSTTSSGSLSDNVIPKKVIREGVYPKQKTQMRFKHLVCYDRFDGDSKTCCVVRNLAPGFFSPKYYEENIIAYFRIPGVAVGVIPEDMTEIYASYKTGCMFVRFKNANILDKALKLNGLTTQSGYTKNIVRYQKKGI